LPKWAEDAVANLRAIYPEPEMHQHL
jgi:hypothetical protein